MSSAPVPILVLADSLVGGAGVAVCNLLVAMRKTGWQGHCRTFFPPQDINLDVQCATLSKKKPVLERLMKNVSKKSAATLMRKRHMRQLQKWIQETAPAGVNLHNIHDSGLQLEDVMMISSHLPVIWTLHDCWPFASSAFSWLKNGLKQSTCSHALSTQEFEKIRNRIWRESRHMEVVAPSRWMASQASSVLPDTVNISVIPYGIDTNLFAPQEKKKARLELGLSAEKVWLGMAATWFNDRKGADLLFSALHRLDSDTEAEAMPALLTWGEKPELQPPCSVVWKHLDYLSGSQAINTALAALDFLVCPSRADNLPNVVLETLACGRPILGSDAGGIPDMVRPGVSGWLFATDDAEACGVALREILKAKSYKPLMESSRRLAEDEYRLMHQARAYNEIFSRVGQLSL